MQKHKSSKSHKPSEVEICFFLHKSSSHENFVCIDKLPANTSSGDDNLISQTIKISASVISPILSELIKILINFTLN